MLGIIQGVEYQSIGILISTHFFSLDLNNVVDPIVLILAGILLYWVVTLWQKLLCAAKWLVENVSPNLIQPEVACLVLLGWSVVILVAR